MAVKAAAASCTPAPSYSSSVALGECSICKTDRKPLYPAHKPYLSHIPHDPSKHGVVIKDSEGHLGFVVTTEFDEKTVVAGVEKTVKMTQTTFHRVGRSKGSTLYLYSDAHTACKECLAAWIKVSKKADNTFSCHMCKAAVPTASVKLPAFSAPAPKLRPAASAPCGQSASVALEDFYYKTDFVLQTKTSGKKEAAWIARGSAEDSDEDVEGYEAPLIHMLDDYLDLLSLKTHALSGPHYKRCLESQKKI